MELKDDFDMFLERFWGEETSVWARRTWKPTAAMLEDDDNLIIRMRVRGVRKEDLRIMVGLNTLVVFTDGEDEGAPVRKVFRTDDIHSGRFTRSFVLPSRVNRSRIESSFENGFLQITLPKAGKTEMKRNDIYTGNMVCNLLSGLSMPLENRRE